MLDEVSVVCEAQHPAGIPNHFGPLTSVQSQQWYKSMAYVAAGFNSPYVIPRASNMGIDRFQVEIMPVIHYRGFATMKMRMGLIKLLQTIMNLKRQTCDLLCDDHHGPGDRGKKESVYVRSCLHLKLSPHV